MSKNKPSGKKSSKEKEEKLEKTTTTLRYNFTEAELRDKAQSLGEGIQKLSQIEDELNSIKADYKKKLQEKHNEVNELSNHITQKYEMRNTPCFLRKDFKLKERQYLDHDSVILKQNLLPLLIINWQLMKLTKNNYQS